MRTLEYHRHHNGKHRTKRRELIDAIKLRTGCVDCGFKKWAYALDFDHVQGEKLFDISKGYLGKMTRLLAEISKCEVVCANCHRHRTQTRLLDEGGE